MPLAGLLTGYSTLIPSQKDVPWYTISGDVIWSCESQMNEKRQHLVVLFLVDCLLLQNLQMLFNFTQNGIQRED